MTRETLLSAVKLAAQLGHLFVATVGTDGMPHIAAAGKLVAADGDVLEATAWFCPATVENLQTNPAVGLVVWDPITDKGYQLLGKAERLEDTAFLNGYTEKEEHEHFPQVERKLVVRVEKILYFRHAPHSDTEAE